MTPLKIAVLGRDHWIALAAKALSRLGHQVQTIDLSEKTSLEDIESALKTLQPHFALGRNFYPFDARLHLNHCRGAQLEEMVGRLNIPCALWYIDHPAASGTFQQQVRWRTGPHPKNMHFFCMDRHHLAFFRSRSVDCSHLPIGFDEDLANGPANPALRSQFAMNLFFAGTPAAIGGFLDPQDDSRILATFFNGAAASLLAALRPCAGRRPGVTDEMLQKNLDENLKPFFLTWHATAESYLDGRRKLEDAVGAMFLSPQFRDAFWQIDTYYSASQMACLLSGLRRKKIQIFGGDGWKNFFGNYQESYPRLDYATELPAACAASKIVFCYTKWQFPGAVHERPLIALGCGGFPLTDYREEIEDLFRPGEIVAYRSIEEAHSLIDHYLDHETERRAVVERGRARVLSEHTYRRRMQALVDTLSRQWNL